MVFSSTDSGPCYISKLEIESQRLDKNTGKKQQVDLTKAQLIAEIYSHGIDNHKGSCKVLQERCTKIGISL